MGNNPVKFSYKQIWFIAYPILISLVMEQLIGMTDTAFMGRVGEVELGASAIAGVYYMTFYMIAFGFSLGAQIIMGRRNGEGNYAKIGPIFYNGTYFLLGVALVLFVSSHFVSPLILERFIDSPHVHEAAVSYIRWRVYGFFFSFVAVMFRAFFVGTTQTKTLTLNSIVIVLSNVVFNYILVFGKLGFPAMGIAGAAIGSSLAELVSVIFFVVYTRVRVDVKKYGLNRFGLQNGEPLGNILNISVWTMVQNFISMSTWFLFFIAVEHLGERSLAITNIIRNVSALPFMIVITFSSTCSTLISNLIGAGNTRYVRGTFGIFVCASDYIVLYPLSQLDFAHLHRYARSYFGIASVFVCPLFRLYFYSPGECLFSVGFGDRQYSCCVYFGTDGAGALCRLCGDYDILSEGRCCYLLDDRTYLCHWNPFIFGGLYEMGEVGK